MKQCTVCQKDNSPYKCPKCSFFYCSMGCCKIHKETCSPQLTTTTETTLKEPVTQNELLTESKDNTNLSLNERLSSSKRLQTFLNSNSYISEQLPVLLARVTRYESTVPQHQPASALARDLERNSKISEILKEAIETDPKISELYTILQEENII